MDGDLRAFLNAWPHEPGRPNVRLVQIGNERSVIQVRLELGVLQLELEGRPDGLRPNGAATLLEWQEGRLQAHVHVIGSDDGFVLTPQECTALREEGVQVYQRYAALFALDEHALVVRDTTRNLRLFDFCKAHASTHADRTALEQYRPFVIMMRARAEAALALEKQDGKSALQAIDTALLLIRDHYESVGGATELDHSDEVALLRGMRNALVPKLPMGERAELEVRLQEAVDAENYKLAAILRDELRALDARNARASSDDAS